MLLSIIHFIAENYGWTLDYIYDEMSLVSSLLLMRLKLAGEGKCGIFLEDKEMLDNKSWDELLAENRKNRK